MSDATKNDITDFQKTVHIYKLCKSDDSVSNKSNYYSEALSSHYHMTTGVSESTVGGGQPSRAGFQ